MTKNIPTHTNDFQKAKEEVLKVVSIINEEFKALAPMLEIIVKDYSSNWVENNGENHKASKIFEGCVMIEGGFHKYWAELYNEYLFIDEFYKKVSLIDGELKKVNVMSEIVDFEEDLRNSIIISIKSNKKLFLENPEYKWSEKIDPKGRIRDFILNY